MSDKHIEIIIDLTTEKEVVEAHGYPGQSCALDVANVLRITAAKAAGRERPKATAKATTTLKTR